MTLTKDTKNIIRFTLEQISDFVNVLNWSLVFCKGSNEFTIDATMQYCDNVVSLCFDLECPDSGWYNVQVKADDVTIKELTTHIQKE